MATFYLDYENGNDANDGTTFANRWKTLTNGATAARIAPGDVIRIMGSPAPTSLGVNGTWTSAALSGTTNISAATNATPIVVNRTNHGLSTGDTVVVTGVSGNTAANGTWEITVVDANSFSLNGSAGNGTSTGGNYRLRNNTRVQLASALTQTIASTGPRSAWTASTNVTATLSTTDYKEHQYSDEIAIAAGFTTGKAAYFATGTLDLSGYQQVSFWIKRSAGNNFASGDYTLRLCSDTVGNTTVNTVSIPATTALNQWIPFTVDLGSNLGSSIQSIALYVETDTGATTLRLNNIIACKASSADDSLSLTSLIGKNIASDTWYGIQSISGTRVMLDQSTNTLPTSSNLRGYNHPSGTETVTTYKRETIKTVMATTSSATVQQIQDNGTAGNLIYFEGGWDRTDMSTQTLETWLDGQNGLGVGIQATLSSFISLNKLCGVRYSSFFNFFAPASSIVANCSGNNCTSTAISLAHGSGQSDDNTVIDCFACANSSAGFSLSFGNGVVSNLFAAGNNSNGIILTTTSKTNYTNLEARNNSGDGISFTGAGGNGFVNCTFTDCDGLFNGQNGINFGNAQNVTATNCTATSNVQNGFNFGNGGLVFLKSCTTTSNTFASLATQGCQIISDSSVFNEATEVNTTNNQYRNFRFQSQNHDNTPGNHRIFTDFGLIVADTTTRHTASGFSWKLSPTSSTIRTSAYPLDFSLAKIAVAANALVTVKAWMYRDNSGLTMRLVCKGGQIAGVSSDVVSTVSATDSWEEQTITFTPTEQGVVEITAEAYGGSTYNGWVDDMTISQA